MSKQLIILASTSPRRREILEMLGLPFTVATPRFVESSAETHSPEAEARLFAFEKAHSLANQFPNALIIGSDTLIECEGRKIGKPADAATAREMLAFLCGRSHRIYTAVSLLHTADGTHTEHLETVDVTMRPTSREEIAAYVATGEPLDKAGAYAIQGGGRNLISEIRGDYWAAVGLPAGWLAVELKRRGFAVKAIKQPEGVASGLRL